MFPAVHLTKQMTVKEIAEEIGCSIDELLSLNNIGELNLARYQNVTLPWIQPGAQLSFGRRFEVKKQSDGKPKDLLHPSHLTPDVWDNIPTSSEQARPPYKHDDPALGKKNAFNDYWSWTKHFICYKTWLMEFGPLMEDEIRQSLEKQVEEYKPDPKLVKLISEHQEENLEIKYKGLAAARPSYIFLKTYKEIFALHCEAVQKKAEQDFLAHKVFYCPHPDCTFHTIDIDDEKLTLHRQIHH